MAIEQKKLPYEILLRFNHGHMAGQLGAFAGAHFIEADAIIDTASGEVLSYKPGIAQELPLAQVVPYLGEKFSLFEAQLRATAAALEDALQTVATQQQRIAELEASRATPASG